MAVAVGVGIGWVSMYVCTLDRLDRYRRLTMTYDDDLTMDG